MSAPNCVESLLGFVTPEPTTGCWLWLGATTTKGYARAMWHGKRVLVHRKLYEVMRSCVIGKLMVCHKCDTPLCVNPSHMFLGTATDNALDASKKGRTARGARNGMNRHPESRLVGSRHWSAKFQAEGRSSKGCHLTSDQVNEVRQLLASGASMRFIAAKFSISVSHTYNIRNGTAWSNKQKVK